MLPEVIELPDHIAAKLTFETAPAPYEDELEFLDLDADVRAIEEGQLRRDLSARDRSLLMIVSWYAANHPDAVDGIEVRVPDRPLRRALGVRTLRDEWEDARFDRFARSVMKADETIPDLEYGVHVPTMTKGMRRRTVSGTHLWDVDERIVTAFKAIPGDTVVELPSQILVAAKSRYTLTLAMRLLAWGSGYHPSTWLRWKNADHRVLRIKDKDFREALGIDPGMRPADVMRKFIKPALGEVHQHSNMVADIQPWYGPSVHRGKVGRLMGYDVIAPWTGRVIPAPKPTSPPAEVVQLHPVRAGDYPANVDEMDEDIAF